jgi:hypothetical protein
MEKFWADSRENDKEVNEHFSRLNGIVFALPLVGTVDRTKDSVRVAIDAEGAKTLFGLARTPPVSFCYELLKEGSPHIEEQIFSPITEYQPEPTLSVGRCTFRLGPPEAFTNIPELRVWNAILESVPPCDPDLAKKLRDLPRVSLPENFLGVSSDHDSGCRNYNRRALRPGVCGTTVPRQR